MAFGQMSSDCAPAMKEKTQPSSAAMKLKYPMKKKAMPEAKESPASEAASHPAPFLKKALSLKKK